MPAARATWSPAAARLASSPDPLPAPRRGYAVTGFVTDGARDGVARIIRTSFAAEADAMTGRVVTEGVSAHVQIGEVTDTPEPDPAAGERQAEAVATLGVLAERFVRAAAAGDDEAAQRAAVRTVDRVLHHLPTASAWTKRKGRLDISR